MLNFRLFPRLKPCGCVVAHYNCRIYHGDHRSENNGVPRGAQSKKLNVYGLLAMVIIVAFFASCVTEKKRLEICQSCALKTIIKDSIVVEIQEKQVPVIVHDTVPIITVLPSPCDEMCDSFGNIKKGFSKTVKNDRGTNTTLKEKDGNLAVETDLNGIKTTGGFKDTTVNRFHSQLDQVPADCQREHIGWWDKLWITIGKWSTGIIVAVGAFFLIRWKFF